MRLATARGVKSSLDHLSLRGSCLAIPTIENPGEGLGHSPQLLRYLTPLRRVFALNQADVAVVDAVVGGDRLELAGSQRTG